MNIIDGIRYGKKISSDKHIYLSDIDGGEPEIAGFGSSIKLKNNLVAVENLSEEKATGGGVQGAAAGAVAGFLLAGPAGTAVGALIGKKEKGSDGATLLLSWANGDYWVVNNVKPAEVGILKSVIYRTNQIQNSPNKKSIEKPKQLPEHPPLKSEGGFEHIEGRFFSNTSLPELALIEKLNNLDESKEAVKLFKILFNDEIQNYNNWKWRHFDLKIETEYEVEAVAKRILLNLISGTNETRKISILRNELDNLQEDIKVLGANIKDVKYGLTTKRRELTETGFFSKGPVKIQIGDLEELITSQQKDLDRKLRQSSEISKKIESHEQTITTDATSEDFLAIYHEAFPDLLKPSKELKTKFSFDNQFYLDTYRNVFDETWDKKIDAALEKPNAGENREKEREIVKESPKEVMSKKAQLNELNELLADGLISDDEYELSRKSILGLSK